MSEGSSGFTRIMVDTRDIDGSLEKFSRERNIPLSEIDFEIQQVYTIVESIQSGDTVTYKLLDGDKVPTTVYTSGEVILRQFFQIIIKPFDKEDKNKLFFSLAADKEYMNVNISLKQNSVIVKDQNTKKYLLNEINKKLARSKILILLFDKDLSYALDILIQKLPQKVVLKNDIRFSVAKCPYYVPTVNDKINLYFQEKQESQEYDNQYDRGMFVSTEPGELLIEYIKPKKGISSINCRGEFIVAQEPTNLNEPKFRITEAIERKEDEDKTYFFALKPGRVVFEYDTLDILGKVEVQEINFRKTGSILISEDKDVALSVMEENPILDAIGPNMTVQSNEVHIKGSVGNDAKIIAKICSIDGTTHSTTYINAHEATINSLKGILDADTATINKLEGGIIRAETVILNSCSNGNVVARTVKIHDLGSLNTITASELIEIDTISGTDNKLIFEAAVTKADKEMLERYTNKVEELKQELDPLYAKFREAIRKVEDNKESSLKVKAVLDEDKKLGRTSLQSFVAKYSLFVKYVENARDIKAKMTKVETELKSAEGLLQNYHEKILRAKVTNNDIWRNFQTIIFKLGKKEYKFSPEKDKYIQTIGIHKISDTEYDIAGI
jgi:hypothetical protein